MFLIQTETVADDKLEQPVVTTESFIADLNLKYPDKIIYLDFWASWCGPCRKSFPFMNLLHEKYVDDLVVVSVNEDDDLRLADKFLRKYPAEFEVVYDPGGKIATAFDLVAMPSSYIISKDGTLVGKHAGFRKGDDKKLESALVNYINSEKLSSR